MKPFLACFIRIAAALLAMAPLHGQAQFSACGSLANAYGPYDYRKDKDKLQIVERAHFSPQQEMLIRGRSTSATSLGGNIDYTLRASPNHHRALLAMARLGARMKLTQVPGADYSVECYFVRATQFAPDDHIVRLLYAHYLGEQGRKDEGLRQIHQARLLAGDDPFTHYNIGMTYAELGAYDAALEQAHRAIALGFTQTGLKERLQQAGHWRDPPPTPADAAISAPAAADPASAPEGSAGAGS